MANIGTIAANGANALNQPHSVLPSVDGVYVADVINSRVLFFSGTSTTATRAYGNDGSLTALTTGASSTRFTAAIRGIALDKNNNLYVADGAQANQNCRVVRFPSNITTADRVLGRLSRTDLNTANPCATSNYQFLLANSIAIDSNLGIYVSDESSKRILYFPDIDSNANRVYGQPTGNYSSITPNNAGVIDAAKLTSPLGIFLDKDENLYVSDSNNNRVLFYPKNTTLATRVWGRGNFTDFSTAGGGTCSNTNLFFPTGITVDDFGGLYIADFSNHRVIYFQKDNPTATLVFGPPTNTNLNACTANNPSLSANSLNNPHDVKLDSEGGIYIADLTNHRVLYY